MFSVANSLLKQKRWFPGGGGEYLSPLPGKFQKVKIHPPLYRQVILLVFLKGAMGLFSRE